MWESSAGGTFTVREDTEGPAIKRGTKINIFLKEENLEYADTSKLKSLVERYSEFINFPIYMEMEKEIDVPIEEDVTTEPTEDDDYEDVDGGWMGGWVAGWLVLVGVGWCVGFW